MRVAYKTNTFHLLFAAVVAVCGVALTTVAAPPRVTYSLDGVWKFCAPVEDLEYSHQFLQEGLANQRSYDKSEPDKHYGWIEPDFDDGVWFDIKVPGSWNTQFEDLWSYEGHGWYRRTVDIPAAWHGQRVVFVSDGANYRTVLYVNGVKAGVHEGGYTRFSFPIHPYLQFGETNTFAILVDNKSLPERVPTERHDWWHHGGLYRSVRLEVTDPVYIDDVAVVTDALSDPAQVHIESRIVSELPQSPDVELHAYLSNRRDGGVVQATAQARFDGNSADAKIQLAVENAALWSPEHPNLYDLTLELRETATGKERDVRVSRVGIRTIQVDGTRLLLNGEPFLIKGVNRYENYADTGITPNAAALRRDVKLMKEMGVNATRCHYPNSPGTYALFDEVGLLSVVEIPLYQWGRAVHSMKNAEAAKTQLREMVGTLRNHPSVFMWSVSNENATQPRRDTEEHRELSKMVVKGNLELVDLAHELDPTRPVIEPSNCWPADPIFAETDVHAVNVYLGSSGPHVKNLHELRDRMHDKMEKLRAVHPGKPILVSEFGCWCLRGFKADYYPGELYQAGLLKSYWEAFMDEPNFVGGFVWVFADSDVHRKYSSIVEYRCAYGLFDLHRRPKESAKTMGELWTGKTQ